MQFVLDCIIDTFPTYTREHHRLVVATIAGWRVLRPHISINKGIGIIVAITDVTTASIICVLVAVVRGETAVATLALALSTSRDKSLCFVS